MSLPSGYTTSTAYPRAFDFIVVNMQNAQVGPMLKQLYVRQALQHLIDQPDVDQDADTPGSPCRPTGLSRWNRPTLRRSYSRTSLPVQHRGGEDPAHRARLVVKPDGTTTCAVPCKCGPGITAGEALKFKLLYVSGNTALNNEMAALESNASQLGVGLQLSSGPFSQVTGSVVPICVPGNKSTHCAWQMLDWGGWVYGGYPSGEQLFPTGAQGNYGGWNSATTNQLVGAVETTRRRQLRPGHERLPGQHRGQPARHAVHADAGH